MCVCVRFCLDGCDPCSYGGVLWCFGMFDGPDREAPVYGKIKRKGMVALARRVSPAALEAFQPV